MKASKRTVLFVLMFVVALAAGAVAGKLAARPAQPESLSDELRLTPAQQAQMRKIWESVQDTADACRKDAQAAQKAERDQLLGMLTAEQRAKYAQLTSKTAVKIMELNDRRRAAVRDAIGQTERLLSDRQRKEYRQIIQDRLGGLSDPTAGAQPQLDWDAAPARH